MRCARGQGTVEYLAVVLLVAVMAGGGTAAVATAAGADIATVVPHELIRALCIVTGGDCNRDRAPCDQGSNTRTREWMMHVFVIALGHRRTLIRQRRSDGRVLVTLTTAPLAGVQVTSGAGGRIALGRRTLTVGGDVTASLIAARGQGRTWVLTSDRAADALVATIEAGRRLPAADQELDQVEVVPGLTGVFGNGGRLRATATVSAQVGVGRRVERATGTRTYFLEGAVGTDLHLSLTVPRSGAIAAGADAERYALTVDRAGRWLDLAVVDTGAVAGTVSLPGTLKPVADALNAAGAGGRRWTTETHLDLSNPGNLAAARAFVAALRAVPPRPAAVQRTAAELSRRLAERGIVDLRTYALDRTTTGFDVNAGAGAGIGGGYEHSTEHTRLIAAATRGLDGQWRRRDDCLQEEHA